MFCVFLWRRVCSCCVCRCIFSDEFIRVNDVLFIDFVCDTLFKKIVCNAVCCDTVVFEFDLTK